MASSWFLRWTLFAQREVRRSAIDGCRALKSSFIDPMGEQVGSHKARRHEGLLAISASCPRGFYTIDQTHRPSLVSHPVRPEAQGRREAKTQGKANGCRVATCFGTPHVIDLFPLGRNLVVIIRMNATLYHTVQSLARLGSTYRRLSRCGRMGRETKTVCRFELCGFAQRKTTVHTKKPRAQKGLRSLFNDLERAPQKKGLLRS